MNRVVAQAFSLCALIFLFALTLSAQPVLHTEIRNGIERAIVYHAETNERVTDENPAAPGESLYVVADGMSSGDATVLIGARELDTSLAGDGMWGFALPEGAGGSFLEISVKSGGDRSRAATIPTNSAEDVMQLAAAEVDAIANLVAMRIDDARMAIAIVDRAGRPLGVYRRPNSTMDDIETALSLARTGAFFSHNEAPLSSRTIRSISRDNFPEGIPNTQAGALYGIEVTNRGCDYNTDYLPGKTLPRSQNALGTGFGKGITTVPGGFPLYRNGLILIGGVGVGGIDPNAAEFSIVDAAKNTPFLRQLPLPPPGAVFIDGFQLPFAFQFDRPAGTRPATTPGITAVVGPLNGQASPDEWIVGPKAGSQLSLSDVMGLVQRGVDRAVRTRAQIRLPVGTRAKFVFAVTDVDGTLLAVYRQPDATIFSIDVSISKARNVVYFSGPNVDPMDLPGVPPGTAVTNRTIGFGSQLFFPSGILNSQPGPFRQTYMNDIANPCTQGRQPKNPNQSGIVFFPGSAALYRNGRIVGGYGVSGDGVEQDDYVTAGGIVGFEAPAAITADNVFVRGVRLPYLKFPRNPEQ